MDQLHQIDLIDLRNLKESNDGFGYLLCIIDVFSKFAWVKPLKTKTAMEVANAFEEIYSQDKRIPYNIQSDKGGEFLGKVIQKIFNKYDINFYVAQNPDVKAAVIERFNRTLKSKMFKFFTYSNTNRYIDELQNFVSAYNNSKHRTIKMAPVQVNHDNILSVYKNIYGDHPNVTKPCPGKILYKVGDYVRISKYKNIFEKGYEANFTQEIFKITHVIKRTPVVYKLMDLLDEPIDGIFYQPELQRVTYSPDQEFKIDKVLKRRRNKKGGQEELYVQFKGYPPKFNTWVSADSIVKL